MILGSPIDFLRNLKPSDAVQSVFSAKFGVGDSENAILIRHGFWHVLFFANQFLWAGHNSHWIGIRLMPGVSLADSPVVSVKQFGASTISPNLKNLIPNWILHTRIEAENWEYVHTEWSNVKNEMKEIHLNLGGDSQLFDRFDEYISDSKNFQTPNYIKRQSRAYEFLKVDRSTETIQFREFLQSLILNETLLPEFSNNFGAWNDYARTALASRAWNLRVGEVKTLSETAKKIWLGFNKAAPFDSDLRAGVPISQFTSSRDPGGEIHGLLVGMNPFNDTESIPSSIQSDPLFPAAQALFSQNHYSGYTGVEHMEAAAKLDIDLNDGKRSYEALISASFWSAMNLGFPYKQSYDAALHLAQKYGWDEMLENLELNNFEVQ
jgi:hypothetical protein